MMTASWHLFDPVVFDAVVTVRYHVVRSSLLEIVSVEIKQPEMLLAESAVRMGIYCHRPRHAQRSRCWHALGSEPASNPFRD
jgi:hypothetical protein